MDIMGALRMKSVQTSARELFWNPILGKELSQWILKGERHEFV